MSHHEARATNWDGKTVEVTFRMDAAEFDRLCAKAHDAFHKEGRYTIRLDSVDGTSVPVELRYRR